MIAKAADYPVNEIFSNHLDVLNSEEYFIEDIAESRLYSFVNFNGENLISQLENDEDGFAVFSSDDNTTYKTINDNGELGNLLDDSDISPRHLHDYKKVNVKGHKKNKDGSCIETIYEGNRCKICNKTLKGDVISETKYKKCPH